MNREQIIAEIERVKKALAKTTSKKLKHDYGKHLKRLQQNLYYYDKRMKEYENIH